VAALSKRQASELQKRPGAIPAVFFGSHLREKEDHLDQGQPLPCPCRLMNRPKNSDLPTETTSEEMLPGKSAALHCVALKKKAESPSGRCV
jgi:hypothetical protein